MIDCALFVLAVGLGLLQALGVSEAFGDVGAVGSMNRTLALLILWPLVLVWIANDVLAVAWRGASFGKRIAGLRVERDGSSPGLARAVLREAIRIVGIVPLGLGWLSIWTNETGQGWHDEAAGTHVVRVY